MTLEQDVQKTVKDKTFISLRTLTRLFPRANGHKIAKILKGLGFERWSEGKSARPVWYDPEKIEP